jgi:hypothetical protein
MKKPPEDLNKLIEISAAELLSGRYSMAKCAGYLGREGCSRPVRFLMTIEEWPEGEGYYNTDYFCELHKP